MDDPSLSDAFEFDADDTERADDQTPTPRQFDADTIMDVYEPYLIQLGFLERTPRGRRPTRRAYEHLQRPYSGEQAQQASLL